MPRKFRDDEDQPWWRKKRFESVPEPSIITKQYTVIISNSEHTVTITKKEDWYSISIKFSKPLADDMGIMRNGYDIQGKNYNFIRSCARAFLTRFGEFKIKPLS